MMKKFVCSVAAVILNFHVASAGNPNEYYWWKSATIENVQKQVAENPEYNKEIFLEFAVKANPNPEVIKLLLEKGADINIKSNTGETILIMAAMNPNPEIMEMFIDKGFDVNAKDNQGYTALIMTTINSCSPKIIKMLIDAGADVNEKNEFGDTALISAAWKANPEAIKLLIDAGADVNAKNKEGETALMAKCSPDVAKLLIDAGADVNAEDSHGNTVLYKAVYYGNPQVQKMLKEAGAKGSVTMAKVKKFIYCHTGMRILESPPMCK